ncbi:MAG: FkbM family methyltransferase [Ferruginibacter sp.]
MKDYYQQLRRIIIAINRHPLAGKHRLKSYYLFVRWQFLSFFNKGERKVRFTGKTWLMAKKGLAGATGNIYMGLHEFNDMGFLLHLLRPNDIFADVGANIGSYTVLASAHAGAVSYAFEPVPGTFSWLKRNVDANGMAPLVNLYNAGVGAASGKLFFTSEHDTVNHVQMGDTKDHTAVEAEIVTLNDVFAGKQVPLLLKIDVEGFETEVLKGADIILSNKMLRAIIIELNGLSASYGFSDQAIHALLLVYGFKPYEYDPFSRSFNELKGFGSFNTIYIRDFSFVKERVALAEKIILFSESF